MKEYSTSIKNYSGLNANEKIMSFNFLRVIASWAVVLRHVVVSWNNQYDTFWLSEKFRIQFDWGVILLITSWAVPIFMMMSGVLLLNPEKEIPLKKLYKYIFRMIMALAIVGVPYEIAKLYLKEKNLSFSIFYKAIVNMFCTDGSVVSYWYVYALIGIYLILPVLKAFVNNSTEKEQWFFTIVLFAVLICIPTLNSFSSKEITNLGITTMNGALFYFWIGHMIAHTNFFEKIKNMHLLGILAIAIFLYALFQNQIGIRLKKDFSPPVYVWISILSVCLFLLFIRSNKIAMWGGVSL